MARDQFYPLEICPNIFKLSSDFYIWVIFKNPKIFNTLSKNINIFLKSYLRKIITQNNKTKTSKNDNNQEITFKYTKKLSFKHVIDFRNVKITLNL